MEARVVIKQLTERRILTAINHGHGLNEEDADFADYEISGTH